MSDADAPTAADVQAALELASDDARARAMQRYFKTEPGGYGEGDVFLGVDTPGQRRVARRFASLDRVGIEILLFSGVHEHRMTALLIMIEQYRADQDREGLVRLYLDAARAERVDNWDLVDASAEFLLGNWLIARPRSELFRLAKSDLIWERRIAIVATFALLKTGDASTTLEIAERLVRERADLIQKAVGWMLREVGKRVSRHQLLGFLDAHAAVMGRTMLSYATEHLGAVDRARYRALR